MGRPQIFPAQIPTPTAHHDILHQQQHQHNQRTHQLHRMDRHHLADLSNPLKQRQRQRSFKILRLAAHPASRPALKNRRTNLLTSHYSLHRIQRLLLFQQLLTAMASSRRRSAAHTRAFNLFRIPISPSQGNTR